MLYLVEPGLAGRYLPFGRLWCPGQAVGGVGTGQVEEAGLAGKLGLTLATSLTSQKSRKRKEV